ncbi:NAD(P)/FAD-dependent oxidoreductase [Hyunsoonleella aestuarii]|uniref:FAD-dependent oxidoreductase n=1 Tax=Hyunsoonleella aestuarii TaxID=912802 RepID=A0ABP8EAQ2_9FLAO|nr:FAD-dependent oxidoreductase [Hyunsoonleella aestuarii]
MQVDYIIVGIGLAGISFCEELIANNKTFVVFDDASQTSSTVAGGLYNPVVLKRFTSVWKSREQLEIALRIYNALEKKLNVKLDYKIPLYRKFASLEEQNNWFAASDKPRLSEYLSANLVKNKNNAVNAPYGFGEVKSTGRIDVKTLIDAYKSFLFQNNLLIENEFQYRDLIVIENGFQYKNLVSHNLIFAEGFGMSKNPFFKDLPLVPTKGELLTIYASQLNIDYVLKGPVFLIPLEEDLYLVGATYDWNDLSNKPSEKGKETLLTKLKTLINCPFEVVNQLAGVRPTVKDRRPLVGKHREIDNMYILNGLGTRGVMIGPYVASQLFNLVENNIPLEEEIDINRFY